MAGRTSRHWTPKLQTPPRATRTASGSAKLGLGAPVRVHRQPGRIPTPVPHTTGAGHPVRGRIRQASTCQKHGAGLAVPCVRIVIDRVVAPESAVIRPPLPRATHAPSGAARHASPRTTIQRRPARPPIGPESPASPDPTDPRPHPARECIDHRHAGRRPDSTRPPGTAGHGPQPHPPDPGPRAHSGSRGSAGWSPDAARPRRTPPRSDAAPASCGSGGPCHRTRSSRRGCRPRRGPPCSAVPGAVGRRPRAACGPSCGTSAVTVTGDRPGTSTVRTYDPAGTASRAASHRGRRQRLGTSWRSRSTHRASRTVAGARPPSASGQPCLVVARPVMGPHERLVHGGPCKVATRFGIVIYVASRAWASESVGAWWVPPGGAASPRGPPHPPPCQRREASPPGRGRAAGARPCSPPRRRHRSPRAPVRPRHAPPRPAPVPSVYEQCGVGLLPVPGRGPDAVRRPASPPAWPPGHPHSPVGRMAVPQGRPRRGFQRRVHRRQRCGGTRPERAFSSASARPVGWSTRSTGRGSLPVRGHPPGRVRRSDPRPARAPCASAATVQVCGRSAPAMGAVSAPSTPRSPMASPVSRARPWSSTRTSPKLPSMMLSGLMRWSTPGYRHRRPPGSPGTAHSTAAGRRSPPHLPVAEPPRLRVQRIHDPGEVRPCTSSIVKTAVLRVPSSWTGTMPGCCNWAVA